MLSTIHEPRDGISTESRGSRDGISTESRASSSICFQFQENVDEGAKKPMQVRSKIRRKTPFKSLRGFFVSFYGVCANVGPLIAPYEIALYNCPEMYQL